MANKPTRGSLIPEIFTQLCTLLLRLLKRGRPCQGPDGQFVTGADGRPVYRECGAADLAVVVSLLRLAGLRATLNAPQNQLAALMERARANGWRSPESVPPPAAGDDAGEGDDDED